MTSLPSPAASDEKVATFQGIEDVEKSRAPAIDAAAEKRLLLKYDLMILPIMTLIFLLNFIDRSAVGNANVAGLSKDLKLSAAKYDYNVALMIFYIFYIIVEVPSNLILKKVGSVWLSALTVGFGVVTLCTAFVHNYSQFIGIRILLGCFEGGTLPGIAYTMSLFYKRQELVFRIGFFLALGPSLSGAFGGLLAGALVKDTSIGSVVSWRKIFLVEGVITAGVGLVSVFLIPTSPEKSRWLSAEEKELARARFESENAVRPVHDKTEMRLVKRAFGNIMTWICIAGYSFINIIVQGTALFLPTIIRQLDPKLSTVQVQLRSVPPYVVACFWSIFVSFMCWKTRRHGVWIAGSLIPSIAGYIVFLASKNSTARYAAAFFTYSGAVPNGPIFLAWATSNMAPETSRAVTSAMVPAFGTMGSIVATWAYLPSTAAGGYIPGNSLNLAACVMTVILSLGATAYVRWENKQRAMGRRDHRLEGISEHELLTLGSKHPSFRLIE